MKGDQKIAIMKKNESIMLAINNKINPTKSSMRSLTIERIKVKIKYVSLKTGWGNWCHQIRIR